MHKSARPLWPSPKSVYLKVHQAYHVGLFRSDSNYSIEPLTFKGNEKGFKIAGVRNNRVSVKFQGNN